MSLPIESVPEIVFSSTETTEWRLQSVEDHVSNNDTGELAAVIPITKDERDQDDGCYVIGGDSLVYFVCNGIAVCRDTYSLR